MVQPRIYALCGSPRILGRHYTDYCSEGLKIFLKKAEPNQGWYGWDHVAEREFRRRVGKSPSEKRIGVSPSPNHPT